MFRSSSASIAIAADLVGQAQARLRDAGAADVLAWVETTFGAGAVVASSFGAEDVVLMDLAGVHAPSARAFTIDTGRLPLETLDLMEATRRQRDAIDVLRPDLARVQELETTRGLFSFRESVEERKRCCALRKVEPLRRALAGKKAWVTGLRRAQAVTRTAVDVVELDAEHHSEQGGLVKVNPLAAWSSDDVWAYIRRNELAYNVLHDRGFPSIGCAPCTRAVRPGEDERAGRWWWESPDHRECGLHVARGGGR